MVSIPCTGPPVYGGDQINLLKSSPYLINKILLIKCLILLMFYHFYSGKIRKFVNLYIFT